MKHGWVLALAILTPATANGQTPRGTNSAIANAVANSVTRDHYGRCDGNAGRASDTQHLDAMRARAQETMQNYVALAGSSEIANVSRLYGRWHSALKDWYLNGELGDVRAVEDPVAGLLVANSAQLPEPVALMEAGNGETFAGQWIIRSSNEDDPSLGAYTAVFLRSGRLIQLEVSTAGVVPRPLEVYCHRFGDGRALQER